MKIKIRYADDNSVILEMDRDALSRITGLNFNNSYYGDYISTRKYIGKTLDISKRMSEFDTVDRVKATRINIIEKVEEIKDRIEKQDWIFSDKAES